VGSVLLLTRNTGITKGMGKIRYS